MPLYTTNVSKYIARFKKLCLPLYVFSLAERIAPKILYLFQVVRNATGNCHETMTRKFWNVGDLLGHFAQVRLVDFSSEGWGHINFDDMKGDIICRGSNEDIDTFL